MCVLTTSAQALFHQYIELRNLYAQGVQWTSGHSLTHFDLCLCCIGRFVDSCKLTLEQMLDPAAMADYQAQRSNEKALVTPNALTASL